jgi:hypothetical protein
MYTPAANILRDAIMIGLGDSGTRQEALVVSNTHTINNTNINEES